MRSLPETLSTEAELEEILTRPSSSVTETMSKLAGPLLILGAGGKMGPTLAHLARRAAQAAEANIEIIAVSRFTDSASRDWLESRGIRTIPCDLMRREQVNQLPDAPSICYLVGMKFGTSERPSLTWAVNAIVPTHVCDRYPSSRFVALSTGNVYGLSPANQPGSREIDPVNAVGEYPNAALARERIFEFCSESNSTPVALVRLNYATELRYGVLVDIATLILDGRPIDLTMGHLNCIWQGDANESILRLFAHATTPPTLFNLTGPKLSVRAIALRLGELMQKPVAFMGEESDTALLADPGKIRSLLGEPTVPPETMLRWTAHWISSGGRSLGKPTHYQVRNGNY